MKSYFMNVYIIRLKFRIELWKLKKEDGHEYRNLQSFCFTTILYIVTIVDNITNFHLIIICQMLFKICMIIHNML